MKFDVIIIGAGLAGLTAGLKCLDAGLSVAAVSGGMNALAFSSGSLDLLGYFPQGRVASEPFDVLPDFMAQNPDHPYARCGPETIEAAFEFVRGQVEAYGPPLYANGRENHFHVTALGAIRPTYLSQESVFNEEIKNAFFAKRKIAILTVEGFRDFYPAPAAANLARHPLFRGVEITTGEIRLPQLEDSGRNIHELRSIDICRVFDQGEGLEETAEAIVRASPGAGIVGLPAVIGLKDNLKTMRRLKELTGRLIYETPTLPPSILGLRLDDALKTGFADRGGVLIDGDKVIGGEIRNGRLDHVHTQNYGGTRLRAECFVLAVGSFFSGGLAAEFDSMTEPVFGFQVDYTPGRLTWSGRRFFDPGGHPFLKFGIKTDPCFNPYDRRGKTVENVFGAGAVLSGYGPVAEGSGGGVAAATGFFAAEKIRTAIGGGQA